jgi:DNA-binding CsgD family transcriptional regulator
MATGAPSFKLSHGRHRRSSFGWESLTEAELRVVGLTAEGLTNREIAARLFVSKRTVATHLEHVFQKLGFSTRVRLAAEAARRSAEISSEIPVSP